MSRQVDTGSFDRGKNHLYSGELKNENRQFPCDHWVNAMFDSAR